ncbi:peroxiredoxin family protein [Sphingobacterium spiritivorum]
MRTIITLIALNLLAVQLYAQSTSIKPVESMLKQLEKIESISYNQISYDKNPFGNDTTTIYKEVTVFFDPNYKLPYADVSTTIKNKNYASRTVYADKKIYDFEKDGTYTTKDYKALRIGNADIFSDGELQKTISKIQQTAPDKIKQLNDTTIDRQDYFYFFVNAFDSVINEQRAFIDMYFAVDKTTFLPKSYTIISKSNYAADNNTIELSMHSRSVFSDFNINSRKNYLLNFQIPPGYKPYEKKELLTKGTPAPEWTGKDMQGYTYSSKSFAGKTLLLFMTDISCLGNQLSIGMMNNLTNKYQNKEVVVLSLFGSSKKELMQYTATNQINFPVIYDAQQIKEKYNAPGAPFFYIIDKNGYISYSIYGYNEERETTLGEELDKALSDKQ